MPMILERIRQGQRVEHFDTIRRRKDGSLVEISLTVSPVRARRADHRRLQDCARHLRAAAGRGAAAAAVAELDHRVNTLAVVHSLAARSLTAGAERQALLGRLQALTNAHELLSLGKCARCRSRGIGPSRARRLLPSDRGDGQDLPLTARAAQTLALVLHELAANAAQHGALSVPEGRIELASARQR